MPDPDDDPRGPAAGQHWTWSWSTVVCWDTRPGDAARHVTEMEMGRSPPDGAAADEATVKVVVLSPVPFDRLTPPFRTAVPEPDAAT